MLFQTFCKLAFAHLASRKQPVDWLVGIYVQCELKSDVRDSIRYLLSSHAQTAGRV